MMTTTIETAMGYLDDDQKAWFSSSDASWIKKIYALNKKHPDDVVIKVKPHGNDGCICAMVPKHWIKLTPPKKMELTDEERERRRQRIAHARNCRT